MTSADDTITVVVRGRPVPQGSGRSFVSGGRAVHVTTSTPLLAWRGAIATEARTAMAGRPLLDGPVALEVEFRPAARPARHWLPPTSGGCSASCASTPRCTMPARLTSTSCAAP